MRRRTVRPAVPAAAVALAVALFAAVAYAGGANTVGNSGFEKPMRSGLRQCGNGPASAGNWQPYTQGTGPIPTEVASPVHSGHLALDVQTVGTGSCTATAAYQDVSSVGPASSFTFTVWARPELGEQQQSVLFGWDHSAGTTTGDASVAVAPSGVSFDAWGQSASGAAIGYSAWHKLVLSVDAVSLTATLTIDGAKVGTTPPGAMVSGSTASVYLGQGGGFVTSDDHFVYDGVVLDATPHPKKLSPKTIARGSTAVHATLTGTNFSTASTVAVGGGGVTVDSVDITSATTAQVVLDVAADAPAGIHPVSVTTGARTGICKRCLSVA